MQQTHSNATTTKKVGKGAKGY